MKLSSKMVTALLTCSVPALIGAIFLSAFIGVFGGQIATETAAWSE
jgi:hypothetical protein